MEYLEPYQTYMMGIFCENSQWLKAVNYFRKKPLLQVLDMILNTTLNSKHCSDAFTIAYQLAFDG